jgi:hypothetical protein
VDLRRRAVQYRKLRDYECGNERDQCATGLAVGVSFAIDETEVIE